MISCNITYCGTVGGLGIGNVLSQYWLARSLSYFLHCDFKMYLGLRSSNSSSPPNICDTFHFQSDDRHKNGLKDKMFNEHHFSNYLPKTWNHSQFVIQSKYYTQHPTVEHLEFILFIFLKSQSQNKEKNRNYFPYVSNLRLLYFNKEFIESIAIADTRNAFTAYNEYNDDVLNNDADVDIVLHYRCGDLLSRRNKDLYGLLSMSYFEKALHAIKESQYFKQSKKNNFNILILTQYGTNSLLVKSIWGRNKNAVNKAMTSSQIVVEEFMLPSLQKLFGAEHDVNITVFGNNDINQDLFSMMSAPILICSVSSFCTTIALSNNHDLVILPQGGLYNQTYVDWMELPNNVRLINTNLDQMLLDTMKIVDQHMNLSQIGEYLITH